MARVATVNNGKGEGITVSITDGKGGNSKQRVEGGYNSEHD